MEQTEERKVQQQCINILKRSNNNDLNAYYTKMGENKLN